MAKPMNEPVRILAVSREFTALRPLRSLAESHAWQIESAASAWDAMERVQSGSDPHALVLDLPRGDGDALHILRWLGRTRPDLPVIVICFPEDSEREREATCLGAREVLVRPLDEARLELAIKRHLGSSDPGHADLDSQDIEPVGPSAFFIGAGPVSQKLRTQAELLAESDVPVLIRGEAGSGRETLARLIHKLSVRSGFPFLKVNCSDMPAELLDAELFGNGANPEHGSSRTIAGKFERADKGTIFLDGIAEMPLSLQAKLMRVLQDKLLYYPGSERAHPVDVRVLAASSANLERALAERRLREDLYYRLTAFSVQVPPLRQRKAEIEIFLRHMMHKVARHFGLPPREFSASALDACRHYSWPGNLTELETFVKRYLVAGDKDFVLGGVELDFGDGRADLAPTPEPETIRMGAHPPTATHSFPTSLKSYIQSVKWEAEKKAIGSALQKTGWNRKAAARLLQVSYRTLLYKIDQYHMSASDPVLAPFPAARTSYRGAVDKVSGKK